MPRISLIQIRRGTTTEWNSANPVLGSGEAGYDLDLNHLKVGNGSSNWNTIQPIGSSLHPEINASASSDNNLANHFVRNLLINLTGIAIKPTLFSVFFIFILMAPQCY